MLLIEYLEFNIQSDFDVVPDLSDPPLLIGTNILDKEFISFQREPSGQRTSVDENNFD